MTSFQGFNGSESSTSLPDSLFAELLGQIQEIAELKVALFALWGVEHVDGPNRAISEASFTSDRLGLTEAAIHLGLERAVQRGILLRTARGEEVLYVPNSPAGRAAIESLTQRRPGEAEAVVSGPLHRPNVFRLYEENIGPLTPMIADALRDAEATFSDLWTAEAIELAAKHNKRNWKYCEAILKRWKEEGRGEQQNTRDDQESRQRDVERKIKRFIDG